MTTRESDPMRVTTDLLADACEVLADGAETDEQSKRLMDLRDVINHLRMNYPEEFQDILDAAVDICKE